MHPGVGQRAVLGDGCRLQVRWTQVRQRVGAGIVPITVSPQESAHVEDRIVADDMGERGRDVIRPDLGVLIGVAHIAECRTGAAPRPIDHVLHVQVVVRVGRLEPGTAVIQVQMD